GPMNDDFLKLLASKTSPEKPLIGCYIRSFGSNFTIDAQEKFIQDVYCDEKDKIRFENWGNNTELIYNWN
uniref:Uncharacterized protein n=1 Tax=Panagrolaimus sp. JU765 TaxID=591449 RepID=A0AC34QD45_9BILA